MPIVLLCAALIYVGLAPAVVNGDGLGYLRAALHGGIYPGHLGYLPLLRIWPAARPVDLLPFGRALSVLGGVASLAAFGGAARRLGLLAWLPATACLGASFTVLASSSDVESYAPALACLCLALYALARRWSLTASLAVALAALMHVENVLFVFPLALALPRRRYALLPVALVGAAYAWAGATPLGAGHGFHYPLRWWTPAVAVYGAAKSLVYSPYPYEASWARVVGCFAAGAIALLFAARLAFLGGAPLGRRVTLAWALPYSAVGIFFFASDHERWIFLLPLLWLSVAAAGRARESWSLALALLIVNSALWLPLARDNAWRKKAEAAGAQLRPGDLVISPGHGWDEYVGFWSGPEVDHFPLVYFAAQLGGRAPLEARLDEKIAHAPRVVLLRMEADGDPMGWKELRLYGITPSTPLLTGRRIPLGGGVDYLAPGGDTRSRN